MKAMKLEDLLVLKLKALYDIETSIVKALPKMIKAAGNEDLKEAFSGHLEETKEHVARLERAFGELRMKPAKTKVEAIRGLIADTEWVIKNIAPQETLDAVLIASARYVEHYEMAGYLAAIGWAELLGENGVMEILADTLDEEEDAEEKLASIAEDGVDEAALGDSEGDEEGGEDDEEEDK